MKSLIRVTNHFRKPYSREETVCRGTELECFSFIIEEIKLRNRQILQLNMAVPEVIINAATKTLAEVDFWPVETAELDGRKVVILNKMAPEMDYWVIE